MEMKANDITKSEVESEEGKEEQMAGEQMEDVPDQTLERPTGPRYDLDTKKEVVEEEVEEDVEGVPTTSSRRRRKRKLQSDGGEVEKEDEKEGVVDANKKTGKNVSRRIKGRFAKESDAASDDKHEPNNRRLSTNSCTICDESFIRQNLLEKHMSAAHEKKTEYKCKKCGMTYLHRDSIVRHQRRLHGVSYGRGFVEVYLDGVLIAEPSKPSKEETHKCRICDRWFSRPSRLEKHAKAIHERKEEFKCGKCGKSYWYRDNLTHHLKREHEITGKDDIENYSQVFNNESSRESQKRKPKKTFSRRSKAEMHDDGVYEESSKEQFYRCRKCGKEYLREEAVSRHLKRNHKITGEHFVENVEIFFDGYQQTIEPSDSEESLQRSAESASEKSEDKYPNGFNTNNLLDDIELHSDDNSTSESLRERREKINFKK